VKEFRKGVRLQIKNLGSFLHQTQRIFTGQSPHYVQIANADPPNDNLLDPLNDHCTVSGYIRLSTLGWQLEFMQLPGEPLNNPLCDSSESTDFSSYTSEGSD
jgi:hypothetical protein